MREKAAAGNPPEVVPEHTAYQGGGSWMPSSSAFGLGMANQAKRVAMDGNARIEESAS